MCRRKKRDETSRAKEEAFCAHRASSPSHPRPRHHTPHSHHASLAAVNIQSWALLKHIELDFQRDTQPLSESLHFSFYLDSDFFHLERSATATAFSRSHSIQLSRHQQSAGLHLDHNLNHFTQQHRLHNGILKQLITHGIRYPDGHRGRLTIFHHAHCLQPTITSWSRL